MTFTAKSQLFRSELQTHCTSLSAGSHYFLKQTGKNLKNRYPFQRSVQGNICIIIGNCSEWIMELFPFCKVLMCYYVWNNNNVNDSVVFVSIKTIKEVVLMISKAQKWNMTRWQGNRQRDAHLAKPSPAYIWDFIFRESGIWGDISWRLETYSYLTPLEWQKMEKKLKCHRLQEFTVLTKLETTK